MQATQMKHNFDELFRATLSMLTITPEATKMISDKKIRIAFKQVLKGYDLCAKEFEEWEGPSPYEEEDILMT